MFTGRTTPGRMRMWPAIVLPLGLTFLLGAAAWLFFSKIAADQEQADARALRLESYARLEAGVLAGRARDTAEAFVAARLSRRADQEKNMRVELKGVMEAVSRVLTASLEETRAAAAAPRDGVGSFPAGFESLRLYLALAGGAEEEDAPVRAMRGCLPELSALMPSGCSLAVVENNVQEILSVGGGAAMENARTESMSREFLWGDGRDGDRGGRRWTLHLRLSEADAYPVPDAAEVALRLSEQLAEVHLDQTTWAGWLVDEAGRAAAAFPSRPDGKGGNQAAVDAPPFLGAPGEWVEIDGRRLVWQERAARLTGADMVPAVAVAIDRPAPPLVWSDELTRDTRWSATFGILGLLSLATWVWFFRTLVVARKGVPARSGVPVRERTAAGNPRPDAQHEAARAAAETVLAAARSGVAGKTASLAKPRLVKDGSAPRQLSGASGVIVADITDDGEVVVEAEVSPPRVRPRLVIPSGSLVRLQERHRGGRGRQGCRVLDQARSRLLRELAGRVRPVVGPAFSGADERRPRSSGRATERIILDKQ